MVYWLSRKVHLEVDQFFSAPLARTPLAQLSGEDHRYGHLSVQQVSRTSFDPWIQPGFVELNQSGFQQKCVAFFPGFVLNHQKKNGSLAIGVHESWVFNHGHLRTLMVGSLPFDGIKWELEDQRAAMGCWSHDPYVYGASMRIRGICISGWFACPILGILDITL